MKEYERISKWIDTIERKDYDPVAVAQVNDRIAWAYKWKKISHEEMSDLTSRMSTEYYALCGMRGW